MGEFGKPIGNELYLPHTKVSKQGDIIEVTEMLKRNTKPRCTRINRDVYFYRGETREDSYFGLISHTDSRADSKDSLRRTFKTIRELVNTNCSNPKNLLWVTLTYSENMQDVERLYYDFKKFWQRFKYRYGKAEYITVVEPQSRGAWHMHLLIVFPGKAPFVPNADLREMWRQGFVHVKSVKNVDNIGAYLSAYLGDIETDMSDSEGVVKEFPDGTKKKFIKGGRLALYPPGMNIYRCSRGIKRPKARWVDKQEAESLTRDLEPTYSTTIRFENEQGFKQIVSVSYYNIREKK